MDRHLKFYNSTFFNQCIAFLSSDVMLLFYILFFFIAFFYQSFFDFFVADDFSWIRWAEESSLHTLLLNFVDAQGFFFRPVDKAIIYFEYVLFGLNPVPYKIVNILLNFSVSVAVYYLLKIIFTKKRIAFFGVLLFSFLPSHTQNLFWFATISTTISSAFILFGMLSFYKARIKKSSSYYLLTYLLMILAVFSYENAVVFIFLIGLVDIFLLPKKKIGKVSRLIPYMISAWIIGIYLLLRHYSGAAGFSGDYNYNLLKAIPNSVGNYMGYVILFFSGENLLFVYESFRSALRGYWIVLSVISFFILAFFGGFLIEHKEKIRIPHGMKLFLFGFFFSILSLLPYLPLGNITMRYVYLASFGFIIMILCILQKLNLFADQKARVFVVYTALVICIIIGGYCYMQQASLDWKRASEITRATFLELKSISFEDGGNIYVYNVPIKSSEAYIFPVGFHDMAYLAGLQKMSVYVLNDQSEVQELITHDRSNNVSYRYYYFDNNFQFIQKK